MLNKQSAISGIGGATFVGMEDESVTDTEIVRGNNEQMGGLFASRQHNEIDSILQEIGGADTKKVNAALVYRQNKPFK